MCFLFTKPVSCWASSPDQSCPCCFAQSCTWSVLKSRSPTLNGDFFTPSGIYRLVECTTTNRSFRQIPRFLASGVPSSQKSAKVDRQIEIGKTSDQYRLKLTLKVWLLRVANTAGSTPCS